MNDLEIIDLYNKGKSLASLSRKTNLSAYKIKQLLMNNGVQIRTRAQQNMLSNQERAKSVNHSYFDLIDNPKKAWILGFIAADGNISSNRNRIKIALAEQDSEILEKIKNEIEIERGILHTETNKGFLISELSWSSKNHKEQLKKYGIVPNKTYHPILVPSLPFELQLAYIQGYFDGDGCFKDDKNYCRWEVCSYRKENLQSISQIISKLGIEYKDAYSAPSRNNYFTLTYSTEDAFVILKKCYEICPLYLERKHLKFINWATRNQRI